MSKICGVVVLYNPENDLLDNITSYIFGLDKLFIIDNSFQSNKKLFLEQEYFHKIIYIPNYNNLGLAKALNEGIKLAKKNGYEWILTMDQDSHFVSFQDYLNGFDLLLQKEENIGIVALNHYRNSFKTELNYDYFYKKMVITSGNIVNIKALEEVNYFDELLFIDMLDYDLCTKMILADYKVIEFSNLYFVHKLGSLYKRKNIITKKVKEKIEHVPQRVYYKTRNTLYLSRKYSKLLPKEYGLLKTINMLFIHEVLKIIIYEDDKFNKLYAKIIGMYHFLVGKMGKVII